MIHVSKIDEIHITDCEPDDFRTCLKFCYNQINTELVNLSVDKLIRVYEIADKFIVKNLSLAILKLLKKKFTTIQALRIYLWMKTYHDGDSMLSSMEEFITTNFSFVFFQGVFDQDCLLINESVVIDLI